MPRQTETEAPAEQTSSQPEPKPLPQPATNFLLPLFAFLSHHINHPQGAQCFLLQPAEGTVQYNRTVQNSLVCPLPGKGVPYPFSPLHPNSDLTLSTCFIWSQVDQHQTRLPVQGEIHTRRCGQQPEDAKHHAIPFFFFFFSFNEKQLVGGICPLFWLMVSQFLGTASKKLGKGCFNPGQKCPDFPGTQPRVSRAQRFWREHRAQSYGCGLGPALFSLTTLK